MEIIDIIVIIWIVVVLLAWLFIRRFKPQWVKLGKDFINQSKDNVKYRQCPKCKVGKMEPQFPTRWFSLKRHYIDELHTYEYVCLNCGAILNHTYFGEKPTQMSLVSRIPTKDAVRSIIIFLFIMFCVFIYEVFFS